MSYVLFYFAGVVISITFLSVCIHIGSRKRNDGQQRVKTSKNIEVTNTPKPSVIKKNIPRVVFLLLSFVFSLTIIIVYFRFEGIALLPAICVIVSWWLLHWIGWFFEEKDNPETSLSATEKKLYFTLSLVFSVAIGIVGLDCRIGWRIADFVLSILLSTYVSISFFFSDRKTGLWADAKTGILSGLANIRSIAVACVLPVVSLICVIFISKLDNGNQLIHTIMNHVACLVGGFGSGSLLIIAFYCIHRYRRNHKRNTVNGTTNVGMTKN